MILTSSNKQIMKNQYLNCFLISTYISTCVCILYYLFRSISRTIHITVIIGDKVMYRYTDQIKCGVVLTLQVTVLKRTLDVILM